MKKTPLFTVLFISLLTVLLAAVFLILTKTGRKSLEERAFFALDTYCSIKIDHAHGYLLEAMEAEIRQMDEDYSRYRPCSPQAMSAP